MKEKLISKLNSLQQSIKLSILSVEIDHLTACEEFMKDITKEIKEIQKDLKTLRS